MKDGDNTRRREKNIVGRTQQLGREAVTVEEDSIVGGREQHGKETAVWERDSSVGGKA